MLYLALGAAAFALYFWVTGRAPLFRRREWRVAAGAAALAAFTAAAWAGVRGSWGVTIVLIVLGLWFAASARKTALSGARPAAAPTARMSADEARRILGVEAGASKAEIQAAYTRLMRAVHPDKGGTAGLAAQLNTARDELLKP
ncbi:MAG: molecular chaperone DnaJ [Phenylobacterium zucineum]|nr:MAG: molecular chaperone DnaJ [Phenylobacterium zucineum]